MHKVDNEQFSQHRSPPYSSNTTTMMFLIILCVIVASAEAWTASSTTTASNGFARTSGKTSNDRPAYFPLNLYIETSDDATLLRLVPPSWPSASRQQSARVHPSVQAAQQSHGMPWKSSICPKYNEANLFYMPFWEYQMQFMKDNLTNLREVPCFSSKGQDMSYVENSAGDQRMHTCTFTCDEYKLVRLTVLDAGYRAQVFTSLWYPHDQSLPVLGIDLLQFNNAKKHLCIVDFQPLSDNVKFDHLLQPVRERYPSLQGEMTDRFYSKEDSYFSDQMLLGRHNDRDETFGANSMVYDDLFPAYQEYLKAHVGLVKEHASSNAVAGVSQRAAMNGTRHRDYDQYSSERDPAHALLARAFGQEWADDYVYDILFPLAERPAARKL